MERATEWTLEPSMEPRFSGENRAEEKRATAPPTPDRRAGPVSKSKRPSPSNFEAAVSFRP